MRRQFAWNIAAQAVGLILPPMLIIALARILEPSDFGIFAMLSITLAAIQAVSLSPLGEVIIKSENEEIGDFIFTLQMLVALFASVVLFFSADFISVFFKKPELALPLRVSCLLLLITPVVDTAIRMYMRKVAYKAVFVRRVVTPIANAMVSIPIALNGGGYWALVFGQIAGFIAAAFVILAMGGWQPRLNFHFKSFIDDLRFSWQMIIQSIVRWIRSQSDKAILGFHIPSDALGQYDMARRLASMPFAAIVQPVAQVMYSVMADRLRRGEEIEELFLLSQRRVLMMTLPLCAVLWLNAKGIVAIVLGSQWLDMSHIFAIMVIVGGLSSFVGSNVEVFKAKNKPGIMTRFMLVRAVVTIPVFLFLAPKGVHSLSLGILGLACVFGPSNLYLTLRLLKVKTYHYLSAVLLRPLLISCVVFMSNFLLLQLSFAQWKVTVLNVIIGGCLMLAAGFYWERDLFRFKRS